MEILNLTSLLALLDETPVYRQLLSRLQEPGTSPRAKVLDAARPFFIAALHHSLKRPVFVVTAHAENARRLYDQLCIWNDPAQVKLMPDPDALPYERITPDSLTELETLRVLSSLVGKAPDGDNPAYVSTPAGKPAYAPASAGRPLVIASAHAFCMKQPSAMDFTAAFHAVTEGMTADPDALLKKWQALGYQVESVVEIPGTMGRRGGIVDIYPPTTALPARIDFFGNTIESIRLFDPAAQRSLQKVKSLTIGPASTFLGPGRTDAASVLAALDLSRMSDESRARFTSEVEALVRGRKVTGREFYLPLFNADSLLSYLPQNTLLVIDEPLSLQRTLENLDVKAREVRSVLEEQGELPAGFPTPQPARGGNIQAPNTNGQPPLSPTPYFTWEELQPRLQAKTTVTLTSLGLASDDAVLQSGFVSQPSYAGQLASFITRCKQLLAARKRVIIFSHQASRLQELLTEADIIATVRTEIKAVPPPGSLTLVQGLLADGWSLDDATHLFTDAEVFGFTKVQRVQKKRPVARHKLFQDMKPGDYVVHIEHGIGEFAGFTILTTTGAQREYLIIKYASGDRLYVPTDQVDRVSRWVGAGEEKPALSRLGTQEWTRTKQRVKEATEEIARDLLKLYASREVVRGHPFQRDTLWQRELEASFPYVETPDQISVLEQVKEDMEKPKPMDRLVCGDVGYGKTEVALRAAFKAVMDGRQVAVLVPTTVLAQQHYVTFTERMKAFPVRVEVLSRFRSPKEQREVIEGLAGGAVDICIGTHRLIQKDVKFRDLGLLIIDEEQRFGVQHKEYLKKMRQEVDVLALSATPIPRTLHMSLVGVRDMSTMETPPEDRLPVKTYIAEYDERVVRESILREMERDGQVFFVHNRVQSIGMVADKLRRLVPEARFAVAHGQMPEDQLEKVTREFIQGKSDVLVCTTIIESGLDMPRVNTLIVNQADRFGLTQLYQLRGRVGRGATLAYAYFLFDRGKRITPIAEKRLRTIYEAAELGAGFSIAMRDLEIRGAGNILGERQSGHISAVGFHLYSQLLGTAVENLKAQKAGIPQTERKLPVPSIDVPLPALIPDDYVSDIITRLNLYQRLADMTRAEQVAPLVNELADRFGPPPREVENLLYIVRIKALAADAGLESVSNEDGDVVLRLFEGMRFDPGKAASVQRPGVKIAPTQIRVSLANPPESPFSKGGRGRGWQRVLEEVVLSLHSTPTPPSKNPESQAPNPKQ